MGCGAESSFFQSDQYVSGTKPANAIHGVGREPQLMARGEFEQAQSLVHASRAAQQHAVVRNGEFEGRQARAPFVKTPQQ